MNRINHKGDYYLFVLRSYFFSLFHFLWSKFKRFIQEIFCKKGALKFPKKQIWALKNVYEGAHFTVVLSIAKEEPLHRNFRRVCGSFYRAALFVEQFIFLSNKLYWTGGQLSKRSSHCKTILPRTDKTIKYLIWTNEHKTKDLKNGSYYKKVKVSCEAVSSAKYK